MPESAVESFEAHAPEYNSLRRSLIPPYERFYGAAVEAVGFARGAVHRVLDLGAGTGLLSAHVADAYPVARFVLQDGSPAMLDQARDLLGARIEESVVSDFADPLPHGEFDAVISSLAIHHVSDALKRDLYQRILAVLRPGGVFVNAEHIAAPTTEMDIEFLAWHEREAKRRGATDQHWRDALGRFEHDLRTPLRPQLEWLHEIGYEGVECLMKDYSFAVFMGRRPA
ncbi:MAG TPA: class I SAM-dependent methyltransferase [Baekduia sp.]|nr:class I SAM-dependent methyltransferase [Baekduia sp.]